MRAEPVPGELRPGPCVAFPDRTVSGSFAALSGSGSLGRHDHHHRLRWRRHALAQRTGLRGHPGEVPEPAGGLCPPGRSEEHTSELQSLMRISYAVFCLKKKKKIRHTNPHNKTPINTTKT